MPNPFKAVKLLPKVMKVEKSVAKAIDVKIPHPMNPDEVFTFPPGTDPEQAREIVRKLLLMRARKQVEHVEMPAELPKERVAALEQAEKDLEAAKRTITDLESRKDITRMEPGTYLDENTGKYYRVTKKGLIEELVLGQP